jgi:hypothetical protein
VNDRVISLTAHTAVTQRHPPSHEPAHAGEPADLAALYAVTDGIELADGTRILGRGEIAGATAWLRAEKSLEWGDDLWVIGERDDLVVVRDLDAAGARAGGGVLEAPTDGLSALARVALDVVGYLEDRLGIPGPRAPEREARDAVARRDPDAIARALEKTFYPGADRDRAHAALTLGALRAGAGDEEGALSAFAESADARARAAPRGAEASERRAAWKAAAIAAEKAGSPAIAAACRAKASG